MNVEITLLYAGKDFEDKKGALYFGHGKSIKNILSGFSLYFFEKLIHKFTQKGSLLYISSQILVSRKKIRMYSHDAFFHQYEKIIINEYWFVQQHSYN